MVRNECGLMYTALDENADRTEANLYESLTGHAENCNCFL